MPDAATAEKGQQLGPRGGPRGGVLVAGSSWQERERAHSPTEGFDQLLLGHPAAAGDVPVGGLIVEFVAGVLGQRAIGVSCSAGATVARLAVQATLLVNSAGRDLFGLPERRAVLLDAVFDVFVLAFVFVGP